MPPLPRGLIGELLTPLQDPGRAATLDREGLTSLIEAARPACQGLLLAGPLLGQGQLLRPALWQQTVEAGLAAVPREMPLLVGLTAQTSQATLKRAQWLGSRLGGRPAWGLDLALYHHSNRGLPAYVQELAAALGRPVLLMNLPALVKEHSKGAKRANLMASVLAKCAAGEALAGLVFSGPFRLGLSLQRALRQGAGQPERAFYDGAEQAFLARPASWGVVSQGVGLIPRDWRLVAGQSLDGGQAPQPRQRNRLLAAAGRVGRLAELLAPAPAAVAAYLAHRRGLIATPRTLAPPARAAHLAKVEAWAQEVWPAASPV